MPMSYYSMISELKNNMDHIWTERSGGGRTPLELDTDVAHFTFDDDLVKDK